ncbi:MAG: FkbM family methyltransferase [Candidatus Bathyarchaeia archaeon]
MRLMNKARTAISYTLMGMRLGCSVIDKINLGTMLFRYKTKLLLNWPRKIHCVNIKGLVFPLFIREEDIDILYSIFYRKDYLFQEMAVARPSVIIDLGAHIGLASIFFNTLFPNARIYCFEPDPLNFQLLEKNTSFFDNLALYQVAIGGSTGETILYSDSERHALSTIRTKYDRKASQIQVKIRTLDEVLAEIGNVDLLKFDVEGSEYEIFANSQLVKRVLQLVGEVHGKSVNVGDFLALFPTKCHHVRSFGTEHIVYLHDLSIDCTKATSGG